MYYYYYYVAVRLRFFYFIYLFLFFFFLHSIRFITYTKLRFRVKSRISFLDNNLSRLNRRIDVQLCNWFILDENICLVKCKFIKNSRDWKRWIFIAKKKKEKKWEEEEEKKFFSLVRPL